MVGHKERQGVMALKEARVGVLKRGIKSGYKKGQGMGA